MGRRNRHFNPVRAGALIAVDARTLVASDNDTVSSWSLPGGTAITAVSGRRPIYKVNVLNGLPAVLFDNIGKADNAHQHLTASISLTANSFTVCWLARKTSYSADAGTANSRIVSLWNGASNESEYDSNASFIPAIVSPNNLGYGTNRLGGYRGNTGITGVSYTENTWSLGQANLNGTSYSIASNQSSASATTSSSTLNVNRIIVGAGPQAFNGASATTFASSLNGHIAWFCYFNTVQSTSLVRRCLQSAAFSFKRPYG